MVREKFAKFLRDSNSECNKLIRPITAAVFVLFILPPLLHLPLWLSGCVHSPLSDGRKAISFWLQLLLVRSLESKFSIGWKRIETFMLCNPTIYSVVLCMSRTRCVCANIKRVESVVNLSNRTESMPRYFRRKALIQNPSRCFFLLLGLSHANRFWVSDLGEIVLSGGKLQVAGVCARERIFIRNYCSSYVWISFFSLNALTTMFHARIEITNQKEENNNKRRKARCERIFRVCKYLWCDACMHWAVLVSSTW